LALASCWYQFDYDSYGGSLTGDSTFYNCTTDFEYYYIYPDTAPLWTLPGSGGSDVLTFNVAGVYLLSYNFLSLTSTLSNPVLASNSTLSGVTVVNFSKSTGIVDAYNSFVQFDIVRSVAYGTITYPNAAGLLTLFGSGWSSTRLNYMVVTRLS